ncbi:hypothetical protein LIA77_08535 [Sarocladium implicatum]|nr:hypothetical protein LIA77_08535 [Sarocladium implicatum]
MAPSGSPGVARNLMIPQRSKCSGHISAVPVYHWSHYCTDLHHRAYCSALLVHLVDSPSSATFSSSLLETTIHRLRHLPTFFTLPSVNLQPKARCAHHDCLASCCFSIPCRLAQATWAPLQA